MFSKFAFVMLTVSLWMPVFGTQNYESDVEAGTYNRHDDYTAAEDMSSFGFINAVGEYGEDEEEEDNIEAYFEKQYELSRQRTAQKFEASVKNCSVQYSNGEQQQQDRSQQKYKKNLCTVFSNIYNDSSSVGLKLSGRMFTMKEDLLGVVTTADLSLRIFRFDSTENKLNAVHREIFKTGRVPYTACADDAHNIYVLFPDDGLIEKYKLTKGNQKVVLSKIQSVYVNGFAPSVVSCYNKHIYVGEKLSNVIKVFDTEYMALVKDLKIAGLIVSPHRFLNIKNKAGFFADDNDALGLLTQSSSTDFNACHFYYKPKCIESVSSISLSVDKAIVYIGDSCDNSVKQLLFDKSKVGLLNEYKLLEANQQMGTPVSVAESIEGYLFVLTNQAKLGVYTPNGKFCRRKRFGGK